MLSLNIPIRESYDDDRCEFYTVGGGTLNLEHSLVSLAKWESIHHKPFLRRSQLDDQMTAEESLDYIRCMNLDDEPISNELLRGITKKQMKQITEYIDDPMTATWFSDKGNGRGAFNREIVTAEIIYYWMIALEIPFECQHWHLNRLLTLIRVCNEKNSPKRKMGKNEARRMQQDLNAKRRASMHSSG